MTQTEAVLSGTSEDKWLEFVATEVAARARRARLEPSRGRCAVRTACVEVQASYLWLLAAAIVTWLVR